MQALDFSHLTTEQKLQLVDALLESIDSDLPISPKLAAELDRRSAAVHSGAEKLHSWEDISAALWPKRP